MIYLRIALQKNRLFFVGTLLKNHKMLNFSIFSFIVLNFVKKGILDSCCYYRWHMYERTESCLPRALWREIMEAVEALILTIIVTIIFTVVSYLLDSRQYKQFLVPFIDSGSCWEEKFINISQNEREKTLVGFSFFINTSELEL